MEDDGAGVDDRPPDSDNDDDESDFVEVDPTGRYGRYDEVLGKGAFKTVYKAFDEVDGIEVAWNQVKVQDMLQNPEDMERLYSEVHLLKTLKHKNIIKFYNSWVDVHSNNVNFITEIFTSGSLRQYRKKHKHVDMKAVKSWSRQILRGLLYLHSHDPPIIHRDLKCDNIFINGNQGEVKIGDLGLAAILRQAHAAHSVIGTPEFMAPELYEEEYNELVDIYSFGMCLLEMITFEYPYSECANAAQIYKKVTSGKKPAALNKVKDPQVRQFVEKCLAPASERCHARELLMDPFLLCEGDRETIDCLPRLSSTHNHNDDLNELDSIPEEPYPRSKMVEPSFGRQELASAFLDGSSKVTEKSKLPSSSSRTESFSSGESVGRTSKAMPTEKLYTPNLKEEGLKRSRDFRVKGKKQDDKKIIVRVRIASLRGGVRFIQFDFDVEADTAMSVASEMASEMVAELELSDEDVITIAEMVDAQISALVPGWKPEVALHETKGDDEIPADQHGTPLGDFVNVMHRQSDRLSPRTIENSSMSLPSAGEKKYLQSPKIGDLETASCPRNEGLMYGRFEEIGFRLSGSDQTQQESDALGFFSDSSDQLEEVDGSSDDSVDLSLDSFPRSSAGTGVDYCSVSEVCQGVRTNGINEVEASVSTLESMDSLRHDNCSRTIAGLDRLGTGEFPGLEQSQKPYMIFFEPDKQDVVEKQLHSTISQDFEGIDEDMVAEELRLLTLQHEREIKELQYKHEQALLELKAHLQRRDGSAMMSKVLSRESTQVTGVFRGSSASSSGSPTLNFEPQTRHYEAAFNIDHEPESLPIQGAAAVTSDSESSDVNGIELTRGSAGSSPHVSVSGNMVNFKAGTNGMVSKSENPPQDKDLNVLSSKLDSMGRPDLAWREVQMQIVAPCEHKNVAVLSSSSHLPNALSQKVEPRNAHKVNQGTQALAVCSPSRKKESGEAVEGHVKNRASRSFSELQESTNDTTQTELSSGTILGNSGDAYGAKLTKPETEAGQNPTSKAESGLDPAIIEKPAPLNILGGGSLLGARSESDISESRGVPLDGAHTHDLVKSERAPLVRRESYLEFYKVGVSQKAKLEGKPSDFASSSEISGKPASSKNDDLEQLKKEHLQKSIAELEAKTLEGLRQSKGKYLVSSAVRNHGGGAVQSGQPGSTATHGRQHTTSEITRA